MLVVTPSTAVSASARSSARSAADRSPAWAMTLASIGSYSLPMTVPGARPESTRMPVADGFHDVEHRSSGGQKATPGILRVDAGLDGVPNHGDVVLRDRQLLAGGDAHLQFDQIDAGDHLGDRVFDLQPGVHLHEEELVGAVGGDDELDGAGADVVHAARGIACGGADSGAGVGIEQR